jgi:hypothetical protein
LQKVITGPHGQWAKKVTSSNNGVCNNIFFAKSTFFHAGQREKKSFFLAEITFFHAGITFFHAAAPSVKKSDSSVKKSSGWELI